MSGLAHTYIHVFVYTGNILEMEDMSAIFIWSHHKMVKRGNFKQKKDTKWFFKIIFKSKGCKYCMLVFLEYVMI